MNDLGLDFSDAYIKGNHMSEEPGNVSEFDSCQGSRKKNLPKFTPTVSRIAGLVLCVLRICCLLRHCERFCTDIYSLLAALTTSTA